MHDFIKIDEVNRLCYDAIAHEYDDDEHKTCRDFDKLNIRFLKMCFDELLIDIDIKNYLDIGVGTGNSLGLVNEYLSQYFDDFFIDVIDISEKMLNVVKQKFSITNIKYHNTSIFSFKNDKKYDLIVSTLCDPFLTKKYIEILTKLISKKGIILLTFPTDAFAKKTRKGIETLKYTTFHDRNRNEYKSYSFCWNYIEMINVLKDYGFEIICVYNYHLNEYKKLFNSELLNNMINEDYIVLSGFVIKRKSL